MTQSNYRLLLLTLFSILWLPAVNAKLHTEAVTYTVAGQPFQGYLAYDDNNRGKRPGVLVVHEWWGHNAYARRRADDLAKLGYVAFALDMYGAGKVADHPDTAKHYMEEALADMKITENRFNEALHWLQQQPQVDADKIAAIGYCFGGAIVLHMARTHADLKAVASFHGSLASQDPIPEKGTIKTKIIVFNGADDPFVTSDQIAALKQAMQAANADFEFINYPGVKHSFTNPAADDFAKRFGMPLAYNAKADKASWTKMNRLFKRVFK